MLFNSFAFILVFPLIWVLYYVLPKKYVTGYLLMISYLLYLNWEPVCAFILIGVTMVTYLFPILGNKYFHYRKLILTVGILLTLVPLIFFKYYNFFTQSVFEALSYFHLRMEFDTLHWIMPIGISFFTFQSIGYMVDVYKKKCILEYNLIDYALFISFFPQIASGPISKAKDLIPQIKQVQEFNAIKVQEGLKLFLWGLFLKVALADRMGIYVNTVYGNLDHQNGISCLVASILYSVQIYGDFAGYSLMAIGVAKTLGINLVNNFNRPYFSISITEFWRRWHISLSIWLRDYIYIPLGGSRCSKLKNHWNIYVTFLVSGLWHGANWTFLFWGILHGLFQSVEKLLGLQKSEAKSGIKLFRIGVTFVLVNFAWIFFRMPTLKDAFIVIKKIFVEFHGRLLLPDDNASFKYMVCVLMIFLGKEIRDEFFPNRFLLFESKYIAVRYSSYLFILFVILLTGIFDAGQFIYVNF